ncbi:MAG: TlpA family protein disulfide reductase [Bacteroidales bacterium]|nr:TlpA family protein disulfide reductase [Bacteroidales bacterium]
MKKTVYLIAASLFVAGCHHPSVEEMMRKSYQKCQSIESGHYEMTYLMKYMSKPDTTITQYVCEFLKLPDDTLFGFAFHSQLENDNGTVRSTLYTGNELVRYDDSAGTITSCALWMDHLQNIQHNFLFFDPLVRKNSRPLKNDEKLADTAYAYSMSTDRLNGRTCYRVNIIGPTWENKMLGMKGIRQETDIWIDKKSYIPIRYAQAADIVQQGDTLYQYEECRLNNLKEDANLTLLNLESIPKNVILKDYTPTKSPEPLKEGEVVPQWTLESLDGDSVSLADLKGKVVLLDFFYKSCGPCVAAMPYLQRLHEQYKDKGFVVVGIDPFDTKEELFEFLEKRGITYTILFCNKELPTQYHVDGYPNLFLLDREGKLIQLYSGYRQKLNEWIEEELVKQLK